MSPLLSSFFSPSLAFLNVKNSSYQQNKQTNTPSQENPQLLFIQSCFEPSPVAAAKSLQSCPTLCDPIDGSPPGSTVPGILQARTLEWVAIAFSWLAKD